MKQESKTTQANPRDRKNIAINLQAYENYLKNDAPQRMASEALGISRSTLRHWKKRKTTTPYDQQVVDFLESPSGTDFLHRLITALQFVMNEVGNCGIRLLSQALELADLHHFVGTSYEALRQKAVVMEKNIVAFGKTEAKELSASMPAKNISIAEDETFHPKICLVAIEPVSNFILLEGYSDKRDSSSWDTALNEKLKDFPVKVVQSTSDEANGIVHHVEQNLGAHHSPDIFHVQYEISKASSAALAAKERKASNALKEARKNLEKRKEYTFHPLVGRGRKPAVLNNTVRELEEKITSAKQHEEACMQQREQTLHAKREIGECYHPYDLKTGEAKDPVELKKELDKVFNTIEKNASLAKLRDAAHLKIAKAKRVVPGLIKTLVFYQSMLNTTLKSLALEPSVELIMREILIPANYLLIAASKKKKSDSRGATYDVAKQLLSRLNSETAWQTLSESEQDDLKKIARECASYFQRSSSCVEGRNGYLSLRHHGLHRLEERKLETLTVIHNFYIKRSDGTTAAERFFEKKPHDLFNYLLEKMPYPGRSGKRNKLLKLAA